MSLYYRMTSIKYVQIARDLGEPHHLSSNPRPGGGLSHLRPGWGGGQNDHIS